MSKIYRPTKLMRQGETVRRYASFDPGINKWFANRYMEEADLEDDYDEENVKRLLAIKEEWAQYLEDHEHPAVAEVLRSKNTATAYPHWEQMQHSMHPSGWGVSTNGWSYVNASIPHPKKKGWRIVFPAYYPKGEREDGVGFYNQDWDSEAVSNIRERLKEEGLPESDDRPMTRAWPIEHLNEPYWGSEAVRRLSKKRRYAAFDAGINQWFANRLIKEGDKKSVLREWAEYLEDHEHPAIASVIRSHMDTMPGRNVMVWDQSSGHPDGWGFDFDDGSHTGDPDSTIVSIPHPKSDRQRIFFQHIDTDSEDRGRMLAAQLSEEGLPEYDNDKGSWIPPEKKQWKMNRHYASKAPSGGIIVREGYRSKDPSATYHGGIAYPGGRFIPKVNSPKGKKVRPRSIRWNGSLFGGPQPKQQYAAKRRYAAFDHGMSSWFHDQVKKDDTDQSLHEWAQYLEDHEHPAVADMLRRALASRRRHQDNGSAHFDDTVLGHHPSGSGWSYYPRSITGGVGLQLFHMHQNGDHIGWNVPVGPDAHKLLDEEGVPRLTTRPTTKTSHQIFRGMTPAERQYVDTALWSSTDDEGQPLDANYGITDVHPDSLHAMIRDLKTFNRDNAHMIEDSAASPLDVAHHLWLNQQGHGTGFWDHEDIYGDHARPLSEAAGHYNSDGLIVGDDGMIHYGGSTGGDLRYPEPKEDKPKKNKRRKYNRPLQSHDYVRAIMQTGRWEPFLAMTGNEHKNGSKSVAELLKQYHQQSMARRSQGDFFKPHGYASHWHDEGHPDGWSFEVNNDYTGMEGMIKLRHIVPGETEEARYWPVHFDHPYQAESAASRLRSEGITERVHGQWVKRKDKGAQQTEHQDYGEPDPIAPDQATRRIVKKGRIYRPSEKIVRLARSGTPKRYMEHFVSGEAHPFLEEIKKARDAHTRAKWRTFDMADPAELERLKNSASVKEHQFAEWLASKGDPSSAIVRSHANGYRIPKSMATRLVGAVDASSLSGLPSNAHVRHVPGTGVFHISHPLNGAAWHEVADFAGKLKGGELKEFVQSLPEDIRRKLVLPQGRSTEKPKSLGWRELEAAGYKVHQGWGGKYFHATAPNGDVGRILKQHSNAWHWFWDAFEGSASGWSPEHATRGDLGDVIDSDRDRRHYTRLLREAPEGWTRGSAGAYRASSDAYNNG